MRSVKINPQITRRDTQSFSIYLQDVSKLNKGSNLTVDQELELAERIKNGDMAAEKELIERNLSFVVSVAKQYYKDGRILQDLISEGNYGLVKAARKFDADRGFKFISYAVWWIRQSILCSLNENIRTVRLPINKVTQINRIRRIQERLEQSYCRRPTTEEVLEEMDFEITLEELEGISLIDNGVQSLSMEVASDGSEGFTLEELLTDFNAKNTDEVLDDNDLKKLVQTILKNLSINQRKVIELYFGLLDEHPKQIEEISQILNLSRERIRQIKKDALDKLSGERSLNLVRSYVN